jgi:hypothetical protein
MKGKFNVRVPGHYGMGPIARGIASREASRLEQEALPHLGGQSHAVPVAACAGCCRRAVSFVFWGALWPVLLFAVWLFVWPEDLDWPQCQECKCVVSRGLPWPAN